MQNIAMRFTTRTWRVLTNAGKQIVNGYRAADNLLKNEVIQMVLFAAISIPFFMVVFSIGYFNGTIPVKLPNYLVPLLIFYAAAATSFFLGLFYALYIRYYNKEGDPEYAYCFPQVFITIVVLMLIASILWLPLAVVVACMYARQKK